MIRALYADATVTLREEGFSRYAVVTEGAAFVAPVAAGVLIPFVGYPPFGLCRRDDSGWRLGIGRWRSSGPVRRTLTGSSPRLSPRRVI
jgi:hypothetical protein